MKSEGTRVGGQQDLRHDEQREEGGLGACEWDELVGRNWQETKQEGKRRFYWCCVFMRPVLSSQ